MLRQLIICTCYDLYTATADEYQMLEVDRALRDVKGDLSATRRRLGRTEGVRDGGFSPQEMAGMKVGTEILVKTGRKAL